MTQQIDKSSAQVQNQRVKHKETSWTGSLQVIYSRRTIAFIEALQDAMSRQAQAERERRARVTLALAEFEAAQKMVEAANQYAGNDRAFQLRWMNIIYELGSQGKNTIMLLPANIPAAGPATGIPTYGLYGIKDLAKMAKQAGESEPTE